MNSLKIKILDLLNSSNLRGCDSVFVCWSMLQGYLNIGAVGGRKYAWRYDWKLIMIRPAPLPRLAL